VDCKQMQTMALEILDATDDGNDLLPLELQIVEWAANCILSAEGECALVALHSKHILKEDGTCNAYEKSPLSDTSR